MLTLLLSSVLALAPYGAPEVVFTFADPRISESSGLATSSLADGVVFTHNDSGDEGRFYAVGPAGETLATYTLPGVEPRDWEDMARGPDEQDRSSLWLGDIGDNGAKRDGGLLVHRVREPLPGADTTVTTEAPTSFRLRYEDGPGDAEALLVHPRTGRLYVVTKPLGGSAAVYAAPPELDPDGPNALTLVADVDLDTTGTQGGPGIGSLAQLLVTAGDISPDGSRVALRTYTDLYEWEVEGDDIAGAFDGEPTVTPLPPTQQGEGLAYGADGRTVLLSTEGVASPVHRLTRQAPVPQQGGDEGGADAPPPASPDLAAEADGPAAAFGWLVAGGAAMVLAAGVVAVRRATRRGHR